MTEQIRLLGGRLKSLKGWLTQSISACENLIHIPVASANESFLRGRIENSITEIDERLKKINDCISELELEELNQPLSDDRTKREQSYNSTKTQVAKNHEVCLNSLVEALAELDTVADADTTAQPGIVEQGPRGDQFKVQDSLKPFILSKENTPLEFSQWKLQFRAFYSASHLERIDVVGQQAFFRKYVESSLMSVLDTKITATTEIFDNELAPGTSSCFSELENEFKLRYPLVARRFQLFSLRQSRNESFTEYVAKIKTQATQCQLETLGIEGLLIYIAIVGLHSSDSDLREKLLELENLAMTDVDRVSRSYESAQCAIKGLSSSFANLATTDNEASEQSVRQLYSGRTNSTKWQQLQKLGRCPRCAMFKPDHAPQQCRALRLSCDRCHQIGHLRRACGQQPGLGKGQARQPRQPRRQQFGGRPRSPRRPPTNYKRDQMNTHKNRYSDNRSSSPSPNRGRQVTTDNDYLSESDQESESQSQSFVRAITNYCSQDPPSVKGSGPTPRLKVKFTLVNGTSFEFFVIPDTGATFSLVSAKVAATYGIPLHATEERLYTASKSQMNVTGAAQIQAKFKDREIWIDVLVSSDLPGSEILLCWKDLEKLHAVTIAYKMSQSKNECDQFIIKNDSEARIKEDFKDILSDKLNSRPMKGGPVTLRFKKGTKVIPHKVYTAPAVPLHLESEAKQTLQTAVDDGVIAKVPINENSGWCFRSFFVAKANTTKLRLIVDMSALNEILEIPVHTFTPASEVLKSLNPSSRVWAKLDANQGYFQVALDKESSKICTFITSWGKFKYLRLPMGLAVSSSEFLHRTDEALQNIASWCHKLVDDLLLEAPDLRTLYQRIRQCLTQCRLFNITISLRKFQIAKENESVVFAGQLVSSSGIRSDPSKTEALKNFKRPINCSDVKSFLGVAQQLASFNPDLAHITAPLRALLKKDTKFIWTDDIDKAFECTKQLLTSDQILKPYDPNLVAHLYCDASRIAVGFALLQKSINGQIRVVQCGSKALDETQMRYSIVELEFLSILYAILKCKFYLLGNRHFLVYSDHKPLICLMAKNLNLIENSKLRRIREKLSEYNFTLVFQSGLTNHVADFLSRNPMWDSSADQEIFSEFADSQPQIRLLENKTPNSYTVDPLIEDLKVAAKSDLAYQEVVAALLSGKTPLQTNRENASRQFKEVWDRLSIFNGLLVVDNSRLVIPYTRRAKIIQLLHRGHLGIVKSKMLAKQLYYWPNINKQVNDYVTNCNECMENRGGQQKESQLHYNSKFPWELIHCDLFEFQGRNYLSINDDFSGMLFAYKLKDMTTATVTNTLFDLFLFTGLPDRISTDNGGCFRKKFGDFCSHHGIRHINSSPYHHEKPAESGVFNAKAILKKSNSYKDFQEQLFCFRLAPRQCGFSPADLFFGRSIKNSKLPVHPNAKKCEVNTFQLEGKIARDKIKLRSELHSGGRDLEQLAIGTKVVLQNPLTRLWNCFGEIKSIRDSGRSYEVLVEGQKAVIRNRIFSKKLKSGQANTAFSAPCTNSKKFPPINNSTAPCNSSEKTPPRRSKRLAQLSVNSADQGSPPAMLTPRSRSVSFGTRTVSTYKIDTPVSSGFTCSSAPKYI